LPEGRDRGGYYPEFDGTIDAPPPSTLFPSDRGIAEGGLNAVLVQLANTLLLGGWGGGKAEDFDMDAPLAGWDPRLDAEIIDGITYPELHYLPQEQIAGYGRNLRDAILSDDNLSEEELASMAWESAVDEALSMRELTAPGAPRPAPRREDPELFAAWVRTYNQLWTQVWAVRRYVVREDFFARLETALDALRTRPQEGVDLLRAYQITIERWLREQWGPMAHVRHTRPGKVLTFDRHARLATVLLAEDAIFRTEEDALLAAVQERIRQDTLALADAEAAWAAAQQGADEHAAALNAALASLTAHDLTSAALFAAQVADAASSAAASALLGTAADDLVNNVVLNETIEQTLLNDAHAIREGTAQQLADVARADIDRALTERDTIQIQSDQAAVTALNAVRSLHQIDADVAQAALKDALGRTPPPTLPELDALRKTVDAAVKVVVQDTAAIATARQELAAHTQLAADHVRATTEHVREAAEHARALQAAVLKMQRDLAELVRTGELSNTEAQGVNQRLLAVSDALSRFIAHTNQLIDLSALLENDAQALYDATAAALDDRRQARLILAALGLARQRLQADLEQLRHLVISLSALRGMRLVRTGKGLPRLQEVYNVHFPFTLNEPPASLLRGPDAWDLPWLIAPTGRWLYWKDPDGTKLYRWAWPPPDTSDGWLQEIVRDDVPLEWALFGSATPDGETTQIVFSSQDSTHRIHQDEDFDGFIQYVRNYHHYGAMGFEDVALEWTPNPDFVQANEISNDGVVVGAGAPYGGEIQYYGGLQIPRFRYVRENEYSCSRESLFQAGLIITLYISNFYWQTEAPPNDGTVRADIWLGGRAWQGDLGEFEKVIERENAWTTVEVSAQSMPITEQNCRGSTCDWHPVFNFALVWTDKVCVDVIYQWTETGVYWSFIGPTNTSEVGLQALGAWDYEGKPATGHAWYDDVWTRGPDVDSMDWQHTFIPTFSRRRATDPTIQGVGCHPSTPTLLPHYGSEHNGFSQAIAMALDEDRNLQVWAIVGDPENLIARWTVAQPHWEVMGPLTILLALSRDGQDALGFDAHGAQWYTTDAGETWLPCPPLPDSGPLPPGRWDRYDRYSNLYFVDEVG
jgi:hypothetical protein